MSHSRAQGSEKAILNLEDSRNSRRLLPRIWPPIGSLPMVRIDSWHVRDALCPLSKSALFLKPRPRWQQNHAIFTYVRVLTMAAPGLTTRIRAPVGPSSLGHGAHAG